MKLIDVHMPIDAPAHEVFDFMADIENERYWNPEVKDVQRIDAGPVRAGAEWEGDYRRMGTMRVRLDEYDRPRRLVFSTVGPRMDMHFVFEFAPVDRGAATDITANADVRPRGVLKLAAPLLGVMMRRTFARRPAQLSSGIRNARRPGSAI